MAVSDNDLIEATSGEIITHVQTPIIASPAPLAQPCRINQPDAATTSEWAGRRWVGHQGGEQPSHPRGSTPEALAPGCRGDIGNALDDGPCTEGGEGIGGKHIGEQGPEEITGRTKRTMTLERLEGGTISLDQRSDVMRAGCSGDERVV
jgi:hypothetical protein